MKNIIKILFLALIVPILLNSCREDDFATKTAAPSFRLYNTVLSSNVLYPTMKDNPFRLTWDNTIATATEYTIVISTTEDFAKTVTLGKSATNSFTTSIGTLNDTLLQAGFIPYKTQKAYLRVVTGNNVSNIINFDVTAYPEAIPVVNSPVGGSKLILDSKNPEAIATTVKWTDYSYSGEVSYVVEVAAKGSSNFVTLGTTMNVKSLDVSNKVMNDALLKAGLKPDVAADVDIKVTAITKSTGGTINKTSNIVTINVTPYVSFKNLYFVGDATAAGWNNNNNNTPLYRDPSNTNKFYYTGYFKAGGFKLLEVLGSWHPQWGQKNGIAQASNPDGSNEGDTFPVTAAGYYTFTIDIVAKTYTLTPVTLTGATYNTVGMIGAFTNWSRDLAMTKSSMDVHQWVAKDVTLPAGELKFRANSDWGVNWGPTKALQSVSVISGKGVNGGENILAEAGTYDIFFNDIDGSYLFIKK